MLGRLQCPLHQHGCWLPVLWPPTCLRHYSSCLRLCLWQRWHCFLQELELLCLWAVLPYLHWGDACLLHGLGVWRRHDVWLGWRRLVHTGQLLLLQRIWQHIVPCRHLWGHTNQQQQQLQWALHCRGRLLLPCRQHKLCWSLLPPGLLLCWRPCAASALPSWLLLPSWRWQRHTLSSWHLWVLHWAVQQRLHWALHSSYWLLLPCR